MADTPASDEIFDGEQYTPVHQHRRGLSTDFVGSVLAEGEIVVETDTNSLKIGDGETTYADLPYGPSYIAIPAQTQAEWLDGGYGPVLAKGVLAFETDTGFFKIGNGTNNWHALNYVPYSAIITTEYSGAIDGSTVLPNGQVMYETDTHKLKVGDGTTAYNDLPYVVGG